MDTTCRRTGSGRSGVMILVLVLLTPLACGRIVSGIAADAAPKAVESGLETAASPEGVERLRKISRETSINIAIVSFDDAAVDTVIDRLAARENEESLRQITRVIARALGEELVSPKSDRIRKETDENASQLAKVAVHAALDELRRTLPSVVAQVARDPEVKNALTPLSRDVGGGALQGAAREITGSSASSDVRP